MASNSNRLTSNLAAASSPIDRILAQSLMSRLNLGSGAGDAYLDDLLLSLSGLPDPDDSDPDAGASDKADPDDDRRRRVAREEARLEREIIRIVHSGKAADALRPNSGQSVAVGDHNICVGVHEEPKSHYRVWEWHGHIMLFDDENGYDPEYIYGNYFEVIRDGKASIPAPAMKQVHGDDSDEEEGEDDGEDEDEVEVEVEVEEKMKPKVAPNSGLRELIDMPSKDGCHVLHRTSLIAGSKQAK